MTVKASEGAAVPNPGAVKSPEDVSTTSGATESQTPDTGKLTKTADEKEALAVAARAGSDTPPVSQDKVAKGIAPTEDPARRIDEMTNDEAKRYSRDLADGLIHAGDESRPAGKSDLLAANTGKRGAEAEKAYRENYARGWNDHAAGTNNIDEYRGGQKTAEEKSAYLAGWHGNEREDQIGHAGGDMKRGEFEKARVSGVVPA
jgi:hypothetical protein